MNAELDCVPSNTRDRLRISAARSDGRSHAPGSAEIRSLSLGLGVRWLLPAAIVIVAAAAAQAAAPVFYVAPGGDDAWPGTLAEPDAARSNGPFKTLLRARDALRALGGEAGLPEGGVVYVRGGDYHLDAPLTLEARDSGTFEHPVRWEAYRGESPRLIGGPRVPAFAPHKDAIVKADLGGLGLPEGPIGQFFFGGARQTPARWPNAASDALPGGGWTFIAAGDAEAKNRRFAYAGDRPAGWASSAGAQVSIWPNYNWWQTAIGVASLDAAAKRIELAGDLPYTIEAGRRFFFQNVFEELDAPGEWWYDPAARTLYFWPPDGAAPETAGVVPALESAIVGEGAKNVYVIGLTIEMTRGDGMVFRNGETGLAARCTVRNTGGNGIVVQGGLKMRVHGNDVYETGRGGIAIAGGDRKTLAPGGHQAVNNHVHRFGALEQTYQPGVRIAGVGNSVRFNHIHDAPHAALLLTGNDHVVEYNDVHHVCLQGADNGAFYMGRDWTERGNTVRHNAFHDIYGFGLAGLGPNAEGKYVYEAPHQAWGVYLDDCASGTLVEGNLFYRVPLCAVMIGGGRDNIVRNNVFVDCAPALHIDARWDAFPWDLMRERLDAMNFTEPPYSERYPELFRLNPDPRRPEGNRFERNIVSYRRDDYRGLTTTAPVPGSAAVYNLDPFDPQGTVFDANTIYHHGSPVRVFARDYQSPEGGKLLGWDEWRARGYDASSTIEDPLFVAPERDDYTLDVQSPAIKKGFVPIPIERIGNYKDEFRASWPAACEAAAGSDEHRTWTVDAATGLLHAAPAPAAAPAP